MYLSCHNLRVITHSVHPATKAALLAAHADAGESCSTVLIYSHRQDSLSSAWPSKRPMLVLAVIRYSRASVGGLGGRAECLTVQLRTPCVTVACVAARAWLRVTIGASAHPTTRVGFLAAHADLFSSPEHLLVSLAIHAAHACTGSLSLLPSKRGRPGWPR